MTAAPALTRPQVVAWRNALFLVFGLCGFSFANWAARVPAVRAELGLDNAQLGGLLFGIAAGSIGGLVAAGHLVARYGSRRVIGWTLVVGPVGLTLAGVGTATVGVFAVAFLGLAVYGAAYGACDVAMNVSGAADERMLGRTVMPVFHAFFSFGTMLGAGFGALVESAGIPLDLHLTVVSVVVVVGGVIAVRSLQLEDAHDAEPTLEEPRGARSRLGAWLEPATLLIGLIVLGMAFAEGSANDWLAVAMVDGHDTSEPFGALVFGVFVTAMTAGRLGGVKLLDRFGRVPVLRVSAVFAAVGLLLLILSPAVWLAIVGVVLWGLGAALGFPVGMSAAADDPAKAAARVSAVATIGYLAFLVGPPLIGLLANAFGILPALLVVLVLVVAAGLVSQAAREPAREPSRR